MLPLLRYHAPMRLTVRDGRDPVAGADRVLLAALGMPGGGVIRVGDTHVLIRPRRTSDETALELGPEARRNGSVEIGDVVDVRRRVLPPAQRVVLSGDSLPADGHQLVSALQGRPVSRGDFLTIDAAYLENMSEAVTVEVVDMEPDSGLITSATILSTHQDTTVAISGDRTTAEPAVDDNVPTRAEALLAGLENEIEVMTGWLSLLTSPENLPEVWGLPHVAGVVLEGPNGCGKSELIRAAAAAVGAPVHEVEVNMIFKPERLLDVLEKAAKRTTTPHVIFVDRLEAITGDEGLAPFRTQVAAILRWFIDAVAARPSLACVLGVEDAGHLGDALARSELLPRTLTIPPPDLQRRRLLFEAALARVPSTDLDHDALAARSAGFSGADVLAAVVHASAQVASSGEPVTTELLLEAIDGTAPSLGSLPMGDVPGYGFENVADLDEVKERLTEAIIWPMTDPGRFERMGIEPPRGILLHGPPGTGKTFVIRAVAHESGAAFFAIKGAELLDKFVGESERGVREVFARARAAAPSILFFDEFDALAPVRGRSTTSVMDTVVAALLTELDGVSARGNVVVVAATNRPDLVDPALLRAGRFEIHVELGLPPAVARRALLGLTDVPFDPDVDLDELANKTEGLSFADLTGMLREAALRALRRDAKAIDVSWADLQPALARYQSQRAG